MSFVPPAAAFASPAVAEHQYIRAGGDQPKGFGHHLSFEVGVSYLAGIAMGGGYGVVTGLHKVSTTHKGFTGRLKLNQVINAAGKAGSSTANGFAVFALTYSMTRDYVRLYVRDQPTEDPLNEAIGATVAGTMQGFTRFPKVPAVGCGLALGGITYLAMKYGMNAIKKLPFERL